jgi:hypothetical protein
VKNYRLKYKALCIQIVTNSSNMVHLQDGAESSEQNVLLSGLPDVRIIEGKPYVSNKWQGVYACVLLAYSEQ